MSSPSPSARTRRLQRRLVALAAVGALMVTLPLSALLRRQQAELDALAARHAALNPMARAVDTQRALVLHRDVAGQVLRGRPEVEAERRLRQAEVDERLIALAVALDIGPWELAVKESDALRHDWSHLVRGLLARTVSADESEAAHRLLLEQALQVVDVLDRSWAARGRDEAAAVSPAGPLLPRAGWPDPAALQAQQAALARRSAAVVGERRLLLAALLVLAGAAAWLALPLWRLRLRRDPARAPAASGDAASGGDPTASRPSQFEETGRLMDRLRRRDAPPSELPPDSRIGDLRQP